MGHPFHDKLQQSLIRSRDVFQAYVYDETLTPSICALSEVLHISDDCHNCIACNLALTVTAIEEFFDAYKHRFDVFLTYFLYINILNNLVEKIYICLEIAKVPNELKGDFKRSLYPIRVWANFLKHPKAFLFVHHPTYSYQSDNKKEEMNDWVTIDTEFVRTYYRDKSKDAELQDLLTNHKRVVVLFPRCEDLTKLVAEALNDFVAVICTDTKYQIALNNCSTLPNFYDFEDENAVSDDR